MIKKTHNVWPVFKVILGVIAIFFFIFGFVSADDVCLLPHEFTQSQNAQLQDYFIQNSLLLDHFDSEFLVIEMVLDTCSHNIVMAHWINSDEDFQARTSDEATCDYIALTQEGRLTQWVNKIGGPETYVGERSHQLLEQNFFEFPTHFGAEPLYATPTFYIINRQGELVTTKIGEIPSLFYEVCLDGRICSESNVGIGHNEGGTAGILSCLTGYGDGDDGDGDDGDGDDGDGDDGDGDDGDGDDGDGDDGDGDDGDGDDGDGDDGDGDDGDGDDGDGDDGDGDDGDGDDGDGDDGDGDDGDGDDGDGDDGDGDDGDGGSSDDGERGSGEILLGRLQINIPIERERDVISGTDMFNVIDARDAYKNTIILFTMRIWIGVGFVLLGVIVYAGIKMITSIGDPEKFKTAIKTIIFALGGFVLAILSYVIINLTVNLF